MLNEKTLLFIISVFFVKITSSILNEQVLDAVTVQDLVVGQVLELEQLMQPFKQEIVPSCVLIVLIL
jgi:hypothetical protein